MSTLTDRRIDANGVGNYWHKLTEAQRCDVLHLAWVHGFPKSGHGIRAIEYDVIDMPLLRFEVYVFDDQGRPQWDDLGTDVRTTFIGKPLRADLPEWWRP